jgi:hypothetical protein
MGQWVTGSVVVSTFALGLGIATAVACHGGGDAENADDANTPQPNQDQAWSFAEEVADQAGADPSDGGNLAELPGANGPDPDAGPVASSKPAGMPPGWMVFDATACNVKVWLPHHAKDHPKGDTHSYRYHLEGQPDGAYLVQCTHAPNGAGAWMDSVQRRLAKRGTITSQTNVSVGGATGRLLKLDMQTGGTAEAQLLLTNKGEEVLMMVATDKALSIPPDADSFMQSAQFQ